MDYETKSDNQTQPSKPRPEIQTHRMSAAKKVKIGMAVILGILLVLLIISNRDSVEISLIFTKVNTPLFLLVPFVFLLGMVIGYILRRK